MRVQFEEIWALEGTAAKRYILILTTRAPSHIPGWVEGFDAEEGKYLICFDGKDSDDDDYMTADELNGGEDVELLDGYLF